MLQFDIPGQQVTTVAFRPDGRQLAAAGAGERLDVFDLPGGGRTTADLSRSGAGDPCGGWYVLGGAYLVLISGGTFKLVDAATWTVPVTLFTRRASPAAAVSADGRSGVIAGPDGLYAVWFRRPNPRSSSPDCFRDRFEQKPGGGLVGRAVAFHPRGTKVLVARSAADGSKPRLDWLNPATRLFAPAAPPGFLPDRLACSPDGGRYAAAGGRAVGVWDAKTNGPVARAELRPAAAAACLAWHPSGRFLATGGPDGVVRFLAADTLAELAAYQFAAGPVRCAAFSPDGLVAAAGTARGRVVVWDVDV